MKKILVPVDFSEYSQYALEVAASLAKQNKAEIVALHMLGLSENIFTQDESQGFIEAQYYMKLAKKRFNKFLDKPYLKGIPLSETVQNYKIFSEINNVAKEQGIDLIVMGSHGTNGLKGVFVGSNTEKVVRTSEVPVLVIKEKLPDITIKKVVLGFDFKVESVHAYLKVIHFFRAMATEVHLVYVNLPYQNFKSTTEINSQIDIFLRVAHHGTLPITLQTIQISDYSVENGIYRYAKDISADLIAILTHGRSGLAHFFKGSIGEDIANHVALPVITFKI